MAGIFQASEIVEVALRIEQNGGAFYKLLVGKVTEPALKELFTDLAKEEEKHFKTFEDLLSRVKQWKPLGAYAEEFRDYLECLADCSVFTKENAVPDVIKRISDQSEALRFAQEIEKNSILFYVEMSQLAPDNDRAIIQQLISREKEHLTRLVKMEQRLRSC